MKPSNKFLLKGFFYGASIVCVVVWFLHRFEFLHIYTDPVNLQMFTKLENEHSNLNSTTKKSIEGLEIIRDELDKVVETGDIPFVVDPARGFQSLKTAWPELYAKVSHLAPPDGVFIFRVVDGNYKALMFSQLCTLVSFINEDYIDTARQKYDYICQYYGVWNKGGALL